MKAVFKRELLSYFITPVGYVYLAAFCALAGYAFSVNVLGGSADMSSEYTFLYTATLLMTPILTMRLISEDKKQKTDQLLFASPVSLYSVVGGKFLAAMTVYLAGLAVTLLHALVLSGFAKINWALVYGNVLGIAMMGLAGTALGMFVSSLTESQIVAAIGGFAAMVLVLSVGTFASLLPAGFFRTLLLGLSFYEKYHDLTVGILGFSDIFFFLCFAGVFFFLTVRTLDRRRWASR